MIVVLDASAAVKLVLDEDHSDQVRRLWDEPLRFVAPTIVVPEVASAITAAWRAGRIGQADAQLAQQSWATLTDDVDLMNVDLGLASRARTLAAARSVRGMDAVYLAVALRLVGASPIGLLSFDDRQRAALNPEDDISLLPAKVN
ncbi:MAG: type II toxin-antitoxin system VapC family toxin [Egibacteraceae bacterium]